MTAGGSRIEVPIWYFELDDGSVLRLVEVKAWSRVAAEREFRERYPEAPCIWVGVQQSTSTDRRLA